VRGFTLVELMITVALIALLVAVSTPTMTRTMERIDSRSTARSLANVFRQARNQAKSRGEVVLVRIQQNVDRGRLSIHRTDDQALRCSGIDPGNDTTQVGEATTVRELSGEMEIRGVATETPEWLCFTPEGTMLDSDGDVIDHQNCSGENARIWIANRGASMSDAANTVGVSEDQLTGCPSGPITDESELRKIRDARYLASLWLIDVGFNGSVRAYQ